MNEETHGLVVQNWLFFDNKNGFFPAILGYVSSPRLLRKTKNAKKCKCYLYW